jgi:hypothetical protein
MCGAKLFVRSGLGWTQQLHASARSKCFKSVISTAVLAVRSHQTFPLGVIARLKPHRNGGM